MDFKVDDPANEHIKGEPIKNKELCQVALDIHHFDVHVNSVMVLLLPFAHRMR